MLKFLKMALLAGVAGSIFLGAAPLRAAALDDTSDIAVRSVSTAGLDLTKPADQALLRHRVAVGAYKVCQAVTGGDGAGGGPAYAECFTRALRDAQADVTTRIADARARSEVAANSAK